MKRKHPLGAENLQLDDELDRKSLYSLCMHQESKIENQEIRNPGWESGRESRNPGIPESHRRKQIGTGKK